MRALFVIQSPQRTIVFQRVELLGSAALMGGKFLLKLNNGKRPIANKYREGKMKSTLKRKLTVRETVSREAHGISNALERFRLVGGGCL